MSNFLRSIGSGIANAAAAASSSVLDLTLVKPLNYVASKTLFAPSSEVLINLKQILEKLSNVNERDDEDTRRLLNTILTSQKNQIETDLKKCTQTPFNSESETRSLIRLLEQIDVITSNDPTNPINDPSNLLNGLLVSCLDKLNKNLQHNQGIMGRVSGSLTDGATEVADLVTTTNLALQDRLIQTSAIVAQVDKAAHDRMIQSTQILTQVTQGMAQADESAKERMVQVSQLMAQSTQVMAQADKSAKQRMVQVSQLMAQSTQVIDQADHAAQDRMLQSTQVIAQIDTAARDRMLQSTQVIAQVDTAAHDRMVQSTQVIAQGTQAIAQVDTAAHDRMVQATQVIAQVDTAAHDRMVQATQVMVQATQIIAQTDRVAQDRMVQSTQVMAQATQVIDQADQAAQGRMIQATQIMTQATQVIAQANQAAEDRMVQSTQVMAQADAAAKDRMVQATQVIAQADQMAARLEGIAARVESTAAKVENTAQIVGQFGQAFGVIPAAPAVAGAPAPAGVPGGAPVVVAAGAAAPLSWISWTWVSSLLSQVSQKLGGAVSDAAFNATLSFIVYALKNAERHFENNPQTQAVHGQIKNVITAIESVLNANAGYDQGVKWAHAKNAIDTLIVQINGARIYFNGMIGIPAFPMPFGNHPPILNELKQILDLLADPVHQHDQTTRNQLTQIMTTRGDRLALDLYNCSNPSCKADVPVILQQLSSIYNITAFNVGSLIDAATLPQLTALVNGCREKLNRNLESNSLKDPTEANTLPPIDAFALSAPQWNAPAPTSAPRDTAAIQDSIETQICKLATHSSEFAYLKFINESLCNGKLTKDYFVMIQQAKALAPNYQNDQSKALKDLLFTQINNSDLWFFSKWIAKLTYYVMKPLTDHLIGDFSAKLTSTLKQTLDSFEDDNFTKAQNQIVDGLSGYFSALSSAYTRVAAKPVITDTLDKELLGELQDPKLNGNYKPHDLYNKVVHKALNEFNPKAGWTEWLFDSLHKVQIPASSPAAVLNPVVKGIMNLIGGVASVFLFIPEKIIDFTIYRTVKSVIIKNQVLDRVLDESLSSLETPSGHTHAVNVIILNLLKKVWTQLPQEESNAAMQSSDSSRLAVSDERKQKLRGLIESLFQVLAKSKHTTVEGLRNSLTSGSLTGAFSRNVDDLVGSNVVEPTIDILIQTFQEIMNKSQWLELAEQALQGINDSFENPTPVSPAEMVATQNEIAEYLRRVLHIAVGKAVDQKFDIDKKIQEREMDKCLHQLKGSTKGFRDLVYGEFTNGQRAYIGEMVRPIALVPAPAYGQPQHDHAQAWFTAVQDASAGYYQFAALEQATANFLNERLSEHTKNVYNNPMLDQKSKNELGAYYSALIQKFDANGPYKAYVQFAKEKQGELYHWIQNYNAFAPAFGAGLMLQDFIQEPMQTPEVIDQARSSLPTIIDGLNQQGISFDMTALKFQLDRMHAIKKDNLAVVDEVSVLFEDFAKEKQGLLQNKYFGLFNIFSSLQEKRERLEARLLDLLPDSLGPDATYTRGLLLDQIKSIATSKDPGIVAANIGYSRQLLTDYKSNWTAAFNQIHNLAKDQVAELSRRMQVRVLEQRTQIQRIKGERDVLLGLAKEQLQLICQDIDKFEKKPILDVQIMQSLVKPLLSGIKSVTINLVQEKAEGCIRLVRNPANYRYGLFHRLVFLPYVGEAPQA